MSQPTVFQPANFETREGGIITTPFEGMYFLPMNRFEDDRGFYAEIYRLPELNAELSHTFEIKQSNLSFSVTNVIRGFHAENWRKLLSVLSGTAFCAFADFRPDSKTFGQVFTAVVGEDALSGSFFLPAGIGNSFCVTKGPVNYVYSVDQLYKDRDPSGDVAVSLFDPDLNVKWPISREQMIISDRDSNAVSFVERFPEQTNNK